MESPDFLRRMAEIGAEPLAQMPDPVVKLIKVDTEKFAQFVQRANVVIE